jgi:DNA helicase-2/ATP-dependent DNA helicase PcrA
MSNIHTLQQALSELEKNKEQFEAVQCKRHCVVLAGPGSGKTKTLLQLLLELFMKKLLLQEQ